MQLYLVRHGETIWNASEKIQGCVDIPLNETGIERAKITGEKLGNVKFDLAISSPLNRACQTMELILGKRKVPIYLDKRIQEIDFGDFSGTDVRKNDPAAPLYPFFHDAYHFAPAPHGESIYDVLERTKDFYEDLTSRANLQDKTILIVTHGCTLRGILQNVYEDNSDYWHGNVCPNCGVNIVEVKDGVARLIAEDKVYY